MYQRCMRAVLGLSVILAVSCRDAVTPAPAPPPHPPADLRITAGDEQTGVVGTVLPEALVVRVIDTQGNPVPNREVTWSAEAGRLDQDSSKTDVNGLATTHWTLGTKSGQQHVMATFPLLGSTVFVATARPGSAASFLVSPDTSYIWVMDTTFLHVSTAYDVYGNPAPVPTVSWAVSDSSLAQVDVDGALRAKKPGIVTLTVSGGGVSQTARISVLAFASVSAGAYNTCAVATDNSAYCWGLDSKEQLGSKQHPSCNLGGYTPGTPCSPVPVRAAPGQTFRQISASSSYFNCATSVTGVVYCWGERSWEQPLAPLAPTPVSSPATFALVASGYTHVCAVDTSGSVYCWGSNRTGELGNADSSGTTTPTLVPEIPRMRLVSAGIGRTCALSTSGAIYCWGSWRSGDPAPKLVSSFAFKDLSVGFGPICAVTVDGGGFCWGASGDGTLEPVSGAITWTQISPGLAHICGIRVGGEAYCWGIGASGELGNGSMGSETAVNLPTPVLGDKSFASITSGSYHSCGLTPVGRIFCWGSNIEGQLGDGSFEDRAVPVLVRSPR